jgi:hypothetical protein
VVKVPEVEAQILSLRKTFSSDITKPFELKPDFGVQAAVYTSSADLPQTVATTSDPGYFSTQEGQTTQYHVPLPTSSAPSSIGLLNISAPMPMPSAHAISNELGQNLLQNQFQTPTTSGGWDPRQVFA